jgi:hypothetical protein
MVFGVKTTKPLPDKAFSRLILFLAVKKASIFAPRKDQ